MTEHKILFVGEYRQHVPEETWRRWEKRGEAMAELTSKALVAMLSNLSAIVFFGTRTDSVLPLAEILEGPGYVRAIVFFGPAAPTQALLERFGEAGIAVFSSKSEWSPEILDTVQLYLNGPTMQYVRRADNWEFVAEAYARASPT